MEAHAPEQKRDPEREQEVGQDGANERSAHHVEQAGLKRDHGDDELGRVAERRVQQPADGITSPVAICSVAWTSKLAIGTIASAAAKNTSGAGMPQRARARS